MFHLSSFLDSLKWSWIKTITNESTANWKNISLFEIKKNKKKKKENTFGLDNYIEMQLHLYVSDSCINELNYVSAFCIIELRLKCKQGLDEEAINNSGQEIIWNNECIKYKYKTLYFNDWI